MEWQWGDIGSWGGRESELDARRSRNQKQKLGARRKETAGLRCWLLMLLMVVVVVVVFIIVIVSVVAVAIAAVGAVRPVRSTRIR